MEHCDASTVSIHDNLGLTAVLVLLLLGACASAGPQAHWEKAGGTEPMFEADNERCGAVASRMAPTPRPDQPSASNVTPRNRMDAPPRIDANPTRHRAYMDCMADRGWRVVQPGDAPGIR